MNPQDQNPYQQPGYQQPNPYQQQGTGQPPQAPWNAPTLTAGSPQPPSGGGNRTKLIAIVTAAAVVVAAGVTGFLILGGDNDKDDSAKPDPKRPTSSSSPADPDRRGTDEGPKATISSWKTVVNPKQGLAFDVPSQWALKATDFATWVQENDDPEDNPLVAVLAPAYFKERWCASDEDKDGRTEYTLLGVTGTKGNRGSQSTEGIARKDSRNWIYGGYTQPDKSKIKTGVVESYTTKSGIRGSVVTSVSSGVDKKGKCATEGKATVFAFKNSEGEFASWHFHGAKGVKEEIPDETVKRILSTVREYKASDEN
ncbi:hypothetical protein [Streptomyces lasiicapitis]|uniref:hypothetical protein n=1 Tax=Streptomyces lasiicapitis TaxID=1923961 RepID=UPI00364A20AE